MAASPDPLYAKLLEQGIILLSAAVITIGGALCGILIYIYQQGQKGFSEALESLENRIGEIAKSLSNLSEKLFDRTDDHESRLAAIEARCQERHGGGQYPYRRKSDVPRSVEDP